MAPIPLAVQSICDIIHNSITKRVPWGGDDVDSDGTSSSSFVAGGGGGDSGSGNPDGLSIPAWAIVLIVFGGIAILISIIYQCTKTYQCSNPGIISARRGYDSTTRPPYKASRGEYGGDRWAVEKGDVASPPSHEPSPPARTYHSDTSYIGSTNY